MKKILFFIFLSTIFKFSYADNINDYFSLSEIEKTTKEQDQGELLFKNNPNIKQPQNI